MRDEKPGMYVKPPVNGESSAEWCCMCFAKIKIHLGYQEVDIDQ